MGLLEKKSLIHPKSDPEKRAAFEERKAKFEQEGRTIIEVDESGFAHDMPRTHGYSAKGTRCFGTQDWGAKGRTNAIGALVGGLLLTVSLVCGNVNSDVFLSWLKFDLLPKAPSGSVIVLDNASFHKRPDIQQLVEDAGCILEYLPPYSPDLNGIEHTWAQAKAIRRRENCDIDTLFTEHFEYAVLL